MKLTRNATAVWQGSGKEGSGHLTTQSTTLNQTQYSFNSRFADGIGTNPEELLAASHAGCFSMKLAFNLQGAGFPAEKIETKCDITLESSGVTSSHLVLAAVVPGISAEKFAEMVADAEANCPISKVLNTAITVEYTLG